MRVLHTSDWHLGQKFISEDRQAEHRLALDWLLQLIQEQQVDLLLVSGDIFDITNPPNYARQLYYNFLVRLQESPCRHVVLTGGNHDSPAMLEAPADLLRALRIHVRGAAGENAEDDLITLKDADGKTEAIVAAIPFLRDRDLRNSVSAEGGMERIERVRVALQARFKATGAAAKALRQKDIPVIAMAHLYASGAYASARQDNIYIGDRENIRADQLPTVFDYVALGHIHRPQQLPGAAHVRYSGSLIPLSFSETRDEKGIWLLDFGGHKLKQDQFIAAPSFRRLKTIEGEVPDLPDQISSFMQRRKEPLPPWLELIIRSDTLLPNLNQLLEEWTHGMEMQIMKVRLQRPQGQRSADQPLRSLDELQPEEVFEQRCRDFGLEGEAARDMLQAFRQLRDWMQEKEMDEDT